MGIEEILLEDSLKGDCSERKKELFFPQMVEFFRRGQYDVVENIYLRERNSLLPDRFYKLAIKCFIRDCDMDAALNTAEYHNQLPQNAIPGSSEYKIKQETLAVMTRKAFEGRKFAHLRRFSDNHPDTAWPIIHELWEGYIESGDKAKANEIHRYLPDKTIQE